MGWCRKLGLIGRGKLRRRIIGGWRRWLVGIWWGWWGWSAAWLTRRRLRIRNGICRSWRTGGRRRRTS